MSMKNEANETVKLNYLVTGANGALGRSIATHLHNAGHRVLATSRYPKEGLYPTSTDLEYLPGVDLMKTECLSTLKAKCEEFFVGAFHVINCAGYYEGQQGFTETTPLELEKIISSNFLSVMNTAHTLLPLQIERSGGHFIVFSCNSVHHNYPLMIPFTVAKAALESFIKSLSNEYYGQGIVTTAFRLATVNTEHERRMKPFGDHDHWLDPSRIAEYIFNFTAQPTGIQSGNVIDLFRHSDTYFKTSYFDRIRR